MDAVRRPDASPSVLASNRPRRARPIAVLVLLLGFAVPVLAGPGPEAEADRPSYDVVVLGSEPEAIAAAVAAAESGAATLLATPDARLGGLFTLGAMNVLDVRTTPVSTHEGIFRRWWDRVGGGRSFDPERAESVFAELLAEAGVEVRLGVRDLRIASEEGAVAGVVWEGGGARARQAIDGDQDLAFAVAAGARADVGFERFGVSLRMADTLVFRIDGIDWGALRSAANRLGRSWATVDDRVAWGHFGGVPASYPAERAGMRLRGLNLGRDDHGRVWANALLIHDVDWTDEGDRARARREAATEAERAVDWLRTRLPGFESARLGGVAERLYLRETRHLHAVCVLDADHLLDGRTGAFDVAMGGYPLDLQALTPHDSGYVFGTPPVYGIPLCVAVPEHGPAGLWAVGRSAGYDAVAHSSVRVVPTGMAVAEGVGVAAARAARLDGDPADPRSLATDAAFVAEVRRALRDRDAYLPDPRPPRPVGPVDHPHHRAYRTLLGRGLALGGYDNAPNLGADVAALSYVYLAANVATRFLHAPEVARDLVASHGGAAGPAEASGVAPVQRSASCRLGGPCPDDATPAALRAVGLWPDGVPTSGTVTRGAGYALAVALIEATSAPR